MRQGADFLLRLRPWSSKAFALALLATIAASVVQEAFASVGVSLHFATFFVAIIRCKSFGRRAGGLLRCRDCDSHRLVGVSSATF